MKIAILDASTLGDDLDFSAFNNFGEVNIRKKTVPEEVTDALSDANIAVVNKIKLNRGNLTGCNKLKLICVAATGYDNIDMEYCRERGITVCNVPGYSTASVAQLTVAMVLNLVTHIPEYTDFVNKGNYSASGVANKLTPVYHNLADMTWGIVGYGNIGQKVAEVAGAFGCNILVCRQHPTGASNERDIDTICSECDVISIHTPLNDTTRCLIGKSQIAKMKSGAVLVNVARGAVIDEQAVVEAILQGKIAGFGSDVYTEEPFSRNHPFYSLLGLPNVCLTPHMAWGSFESRVQCIRTIMDNIRSYLNQCPKNTV